MYREPSRLVAGSARTRHATLKQRASKAARSSAPRPTRWSASCSSVSVRSSSWSAPASISRRTEDGGRVKIGGGPRPTRTAPDPPDPPRTTLGTPGYPWDQSTRVLGSTPHAPASTTASITWSSSSLVCQPSVIGCSASGGRRMLDSSGSPSSCSNARTTGWARCDRLDGAERGLVQLDELGESPRKQGSNEREAVSVVQRPKPADALPTVRVVQSAARRVARVRGR